MTEPKFFTTPSGDEMALLPRADLEWLMRLAGVGKLAARPADDDAEDIEDAARANAILARLGDGYERTLTLVEARELAASPTPLAFWRKREGLSQAELAGLVGITQAYVSDLESGRRDGTLAVYRSLADRLGLTLDQIAPAAKPES